MPNNILFIFILFIVWETSFAYINVRNEEPESWTGRWFPEPPEKFTEFTNHEMSQINPKTHDSRIPMGVKNSSCDDAKTNLTVDWDGNYLDYTCMYPRARFVPDERFDQLLEFENIPKAYQAPHFCMTDHIRYSHPLPTFGPHRPLWPVYGEYKFLPKQRWLHSLEHGAIVALYHPCADIRETLHLKQLVKSCIRRHVISASSDLTKERPFALLAWGVRMTMPQVYTNSVVQFIREHALKGSEHISRDGNFVEGLIKKAEIVSDIEDTKLCPFFGKKI